MDKNNESSETRRYESKYSPGKFITGAQWLAELMCERKARHNKKDLPPFFWKDKEWSKFLVHQVVVANRLFKAFPEKAIGRALRRKELSLVWSLADKRVRPIIKDEEKKLKFELEQQKVEQESVPPPLDEVGKNGNERPIMDKNNIINKLKGL